ncbi:PBSX family phage terminase large subunit [Candidatus Saccharibacteria bacterium]|nr:MAG: PBSX family phage terminase large subunit [Candidatus Saccharibacteria bacterium]
MLDIPEKLIPFLVNINDYRYFLAEGGRGGSKSQSVGRLILYIAEKLPLRIVCGRETQNTINESVYSLMADLVRQHNLDFEIQASKLIHRQSGTEITFRGFRQQGAFNIQGMEGIDIVWIDESQALTKQTIDVLIPTIRKDNAKIFFTMNRHVENDPAFEMFARRKDCLHVHINYTDNKYCTQALKNEAQECKERSIDDYEHIWLGKPLSKSEDAVFSLEELIATGNDRYQLRPNYGMRLAGFDVARYGDDKCAVVIIQQMGALHWEVIHVEEWGQKDTNYSTGRFLSIFSDHKVDRGIIDEDGIGGPVLDTLNKGRGINAFTGFRNPTLAYKDNKDYANMRTVNTYRLKELVSRGHIAITDEGLIRELITLRYTFDHQQRKILISKEQMRKDKVKSPNMADALIMAVSLIGDVKQEQERQYIPRQTTQFKEESLFGIAGIR